MKTKLSVFLAAAVCAACADTVIQLPVFGRVKVLDTVDCTVKDHDFHEYPEGGSRVEKILGRDCRVMPVLRDESSFFSYRLGKGRGLKANGSYVIVLDYPDDRPRTYLIHNRATSSRRSFCTGAALGDAWEAKYVDGHAESLDLPQSGAWEQWTCYTSLMDLTHDWNENSREVLNADGTPRRNGKGEIVREPVYNKPADGFDFVVAQYGRDHEPMSAGIAVSRIMLCEIPDEKACYARQAFPAGLPRRHIFWREEMSDGGPLQGDNPQCANRYDWFEHKARQMKMLGVNTYMKDLLEFGHVQHWDPDFIRPQWAWASTPEVNALWERALEIMTRYGFDVMPYYEWVGNKGAKVDGKPSFGDQKRAETLNGEKNYTHVWWTEGANLDITDPESVLATKQLFDGTILRFKDKAKFAGAFFRTRPTEWPVSFSDATRARFAKEANGGMAVSRDDLRNNRRLYDKYLEWWHMRRVKFLAELRAYLVEKGLPEAQVILDSEASEPGPGIAGGGLLTDDPAAVKETFAAAGLKEPKCVTPAETLASHAFLRQRREPAGTWGKFEWQHACPGDDPENYNNQVGIGLAMPFNRLYSVNDPDAFKAYCNAGGTQTIVRHYSLNENMVYKKNGGSEERIVGYHICDMERAGRACMMNEVWAMAKGDPVNLGYLMGSCFARGFPGPVREFNLNYLALPALPSKVVQGACGDADVTVRRIDCTGYGRAPYYMLVHTGKTDKSDVKVSIPGVKSLKAAVSGRTFKADENGVFTFPRVRAWQLVAFTAE